MFFCSLNYRNFNHIIYLWSLLFHLALLRLLSHLVAYQDRYVFKRKWTFLRANTKVRDDEKKENGESQNSKEIARSKPGVKSDPGELEGMRSRFGQRPLYKRAFCSPSYVWYIIARDDIIFQVGRFYASPRSSQLDVGDDLENTKSEAGHRRLQSARQSGSKET